jgi:hypothetical protein
MGSTKSSLVPSIVVEKITDVVASRVSRIADRIGQLQLQNIKVPEAIFRYFDVNHCYGSEEELASAVLFGLHTLSNEEKLMFAKLLCPETHEVVEKV